MRIVATLLLAILVLSLTARLRPPEYDEAYSIFLTAGDARPAWPTGIFHPGEVRGFYAPDATPKAIAQSLRTGDVHPPLYFWALEYWRRLFGPSWFAARTLSILFSLAALTALAWLAALAEIPIATTLLITSLSYGFAYTGSITRDFALAQFLNILGMALTYKGSKDQKWIFGFAGGIAFGAAAFANYLAIFIGLATLIWLLSRQANRKTFIPTTIGFTLFLPAIAYFYIGQHSSRIGQFVAFSLHHAIPLLAKDSGAALFGGLPLYAGQLRDFVAIALAALIAICAGFIIKNWHPKLHPFAISALATPAGLVALGLIFNNTPIEIRYLAFAMPFTALLLAATLPRKPLYLLLGLEACGIAGLIIAPATMQPQGIAARHLREVTAQSPLILLPYGNDGVGIPGPFIASAPDDLRLELLKPNTNPNLATERNVILVTIGIDASSKQTTANALIIFKENPCLLQKSSTKFIRVYVQTCSGSLMSH